MSLDDAVAVEPRYRLAHLPTPLQRMERLTSHLGGPRLWVKRDDLTGLGLGGNKVRKLEYVIPEALELRADILVTSGGAQSNSVRQIAAAAVRAGLACHVVQLVDRVVPESAPAPRVGNAMVIPLLGASIERVKWTGDRAAAIEHAASELAGAGHRPYIVPYGVSNPLGAIGYVAAALEMQIQFERAGFEPRAVVHASGSGGTQAGLVVGFFPHHVHVIGVDVDAEPSRVRSDVSAIAVQLANELELDARGVDAAIEVEPGFAGPHYGAITDATVEAIDLAARLEGLILDPVYSAKALAAVIGLSRSGRFGPDDDIVFIHTGGAPSLLAQPDLLPQVEARR